MRIVALYDALTELTPSPVVELNRAVAVSMAFGAEAGLEAVDALAGEKALAGYHLLPSVRGELLRRLGRAEEARAEYARAAAMTAQRARAAACCSSAPPRRLGRPNYTRRHGPHAVPHPIVESTEWITPRMVRIVVERRRARALRVRRVHRPLREGAAPAARRRTTRRRSTWRTPRAAPARHVAAHPQLHRPRVGRRAAAAHARLRRPRRRRHRRPVGCRRQARRRAPAGRPRRRATRPTRTPTGT